MNNSIPEIILWPVRSDPISVIIPGGDYRWIVGELRVGPGQPVNREVDFLIAGTVGSGVGDLITSLDHLRGSDPVPLSGPANPDHQSLVWQGSARVFLLWV